MLSRQAIIDELWQLGIVPSKEKGQNFLFDPGALAEIVMFGKPATNERILEIGPGLGALTGELLDCKELVLVELEPIFSTYLAKRFTDKKILNQDIRTFDFTKLGSGWTVFGNLPYSLSTDIILFLVNNRQSIKRAVVLLQKEFAERIFAKPGSKDFGTLSLQVQLFADVYPGPTISGECFYPQAAVISQVIEVKFLEQPRFSLDNKQVFDRVVKAAFMKRRKKLLNSLKSSGLLQPSLLSDALENAGIDPGLRAEQLGLDKFVQLANCYYQLEIQ